jgi:hypothetical protein
MVSPFGGDGGDNIVDHTNGDRAVHEYVNLDMALTTNGGRSDGTTPSYREISPSCFAFTYTPSPCDPSPRFIAPFEADPASPAHWVAGGRDVWDNQGNGWDTTCGASACDWKIVGDSGSGRSITQVAIANGAFIATAGQGAATTWSRFGVLPNASINDLQPSPSDSYLIAATHGRGLWKIATP